MVGELVGARVELRVGELLVLVLHGDRVGRARGLACEELVQTHLGKLGGGGVPVVEQLLALGFGEDRERGDRRLGTELGGRQQGSHMAGQRIGLLRLAQGPVRSNEEPPSSPEDSTRASSSAGAAPAESRSRSSIAVLTRARSSGKVGAAAQIERERERFSGAVGAVADDQLRAVGIAREHRGDARDRDTVGKLVPNALSRSYVRLHGSIAESLRLPLCAPARSPPTPWPGRKW